MARADSRPRPEAEQVQEKLRRYLDCYGWDVVEDESRWRELQRRRMTGEYGDEEW